MMTPVAKELGLISKPGQRLHVSRRLADSNVPAIVKHNRHVGEVIFAYNTAHAAVFNMYFCVSLGDSHHNAKEIWHALPSDKSQRKLALLYIKNNSRLTKTIKSRSIWAIESLATLSVFRNDAAHADMFWFYDRIKVSEFNKDGTIDRLNRLPFEKHWVALRGDLSALANYMHSLAMDMLFESARSSSKKPKLQLARSMSAKAQEKQRRAKKASRESQRQLSRASFQP